MFCYIWISTKLCKLLVGTPITFLIIQNKLKMKKIWGFKLERFKVFFPKHFKQNITVLDFEIKLFSHCFATFEVQRGIVDC